ncbi:MAG: hypothetical protein ACFFDO_00620 [Candidatus Thorarchaeota archaeon]
MLSTYNGKEGITVKVVHDLQRRIMEIFSFFRVMNNYYYKKTELQKQIRPLIFKKFKEGLITIQRNIDWFFTIPTALNTLSNDFISKKDSFRFPDGIILFEAWMNLGLEALFPRLVLHFKFPGFLKGENTRHVFQFIYSFSRGFGFPIYFGPEFYSYKFKYSKLLDPLFKWGYTVYHKANQAIFLVNRKFKSKRHHPGEFESVMISEYENNVFKGVDTLLHGYFTGESKYLGKFTSLEETLQNVNFSYTIGDHAMSVQKSTSDNNPINTLNIPLISYENIVQKYEIDFYSYIKNLMSLRKLLVKKISFYKKKKKNLIKNYNLIDKFRFYFELLIPRRKLSRQFSIIRKCILYNNLFEKLKELLWTTPLYTHTIHSPTTKELKLKFLIKREDFDQESTNSILLTYIKLYEKEQGFVFDDKEIIEALKNLRDQMGKMWLYFRERQFRYAVRKLNEINSLSLDDIDYKRKINDNLDKLIPIFSIYELFNRSLTESVYPESIGQTRRLGAHLAKFFAWKYNPIGVNLMNLLNKLAYYNWSFLITKKKLNYKEFFNLALKLPIWKHIPTKLKRDILKN